MTKDIVDKLESRHLRGARKGVGSGEDRRRSQPADVGPPSPAEVAALFKRDQQPIRSMDEKPERPNRADRKQANQDPQDAHAVGYRNDVADGWLRGTGIRGATARPDFDHGGRRTLRQSGDGVGLVGERMEKGVSDNSHKASPDLGGMKSSPFSGAHFKGRGER